MCNVSLGDYRTYLTIYLKILYSRKTPVSHLIAFEAPAI